MFPAGDIIDLLQARASSGRDAATARNGEIWPNIIAR